jgi:hypothetical protein
MRLLTSSGQLFRRKATAFALAAGLLTASACWWWLPPTPLFRDAATEVNNSVSPHFSPRMNYAVYTSNDPTYKKYPFNEKEDSGSASVWDLRTGVPCFSFRFSERPDIRFNEDETLCVEFYSSRGTAYLREMPTGVLKTPDQPIEIPPKSGLLADAKGRLFILIGDLKQRPWLIRDLLTGEEAGSFSLPPDKDCSGGLSYPGVLRVHIIEYRNSFPIELRQVPTGKLLWKDTLDRAWDQELTRTIRITPDGKTTVQIYGQVHVSDNAGTHRVFPIPRGAIEDLSPDGRYLLIQGYGEDTPPWLKKLYEWCGIPTKQSGSAYLYDLKTGQELGRFANTWFGQISVDSNRLAVGGKEGWAVYDLPLRKPWPTIIGYALGVAVAVFLVGVFFGRFRRRKPAVAVSPVGA